MRPSKQRWGKEVSDIAKLSSPAETGGFTTYEQLPREAFKSDSFEVVALDDALKRSLVSRESGQKSQRASCPSYSRPAEKSQVISMAEDVPVLTQEILKSQLSCVMWEEMDALWQAVHGILAQEEGSGQEKMTMIKTIFDNFMKSLGNDNGCPEMRQVRTSQRGNPQVSKN